MSRQIPPDTVSPADGGAQGDIGRRIAQRREEMGLTREEAAARAGTAPGYIRYLEEQPTATPGVGVLIRLADVLGTSVAALRGGDADRTPGTRRAARHPELLALGPDECRARLSTHGIGRLALDTPEGPYIGPLNYTVVDGVVFCRTTPGSIPAAADGARVAFEVDHIDEGLRQGWSVLVRGRARAVTDPAEVRRLEELAYSAPWAGGEGLMWLSIDTAHISGRRIRVDR